MTYEDSPKWIAHWIDILLTRICNLKVAVLSFENVNEILNVSTKMSQRATSETGFLSQLMNFDYEILAIIFQLQAQ